MADPNHQRPPMWEALFDALAREQDAILAEIRARLQAELPSYQALPAEALDLHLRLSLERMLASARAGRSNISDRELAALTEVGEVQAQYGIPVDDMLRVWRMGIEILVARARTLGTQLGIEDAEILEFVQAALAWADVGMVTEAGAHRRAEIEMARQDHERRASFVRGVLLGTLAPTAIRIDADAYGIDTSREYIAIRARPAADGTRGELERALGFHDVAPHRRGLSALVDGDLAGFLREPPRGDIPGVAGIGPAAPIDRLAESFRLATRALATADSFGLTGVIDMDALGMRPAIATDRDVSETLQRRYLAPLASTPAGADVIATLRTYLACGMHVERAAEQLFIHPNTLRYRLSRFEELTGANLRDTTVVAELSWALQAAAIHTNTPKPD